MQFIIEAVTIFEVWQCQVSMGGGIEKKKNEIFVII